MSYKDSINDEFANFKNKKSAPRVVAYSMINKILHLSSISK